ncbi:uncharacterized protein CMC5_017640 [Chondromyces crocatus]|uniref:Uncharacterized protein n=2 Tax=Chondromyces crocatus TaxID=52 RepID=A0A0K1EAD0_CHOCO|nr:uncharacterized protein CMC5_017640 [Chondromyces crocatus]
MRALYLAVLSGLCTLPGAGCDQKAAAVSRDATLAQPGPGAGLKAQARPVGEGGRIEAGGRIERDGLSIAFSMRPLASDRGSGGRVEDDVVTAGADAVVELFVTDAKTGAPVRGLAPLGWMSRSEEAAPLGEAGCRSKIKNYMAGLLSVRPDVDLNDYLLWTLNEDSSLSVIDPHVAFSRTKLRSVVSLAAPGVAFTMTPSNESLFVTLGGGRGVAMVDTRQAIVRRNIQVGREPAAISIAPDGRSVWVGNDGDGTVSVLDARSGDLLKTLPVGPGHHELAFSGGGGTAWITNRAGASVTVIDAVALETIGQVEVGEGAVSIAASDEAGAVHVSLGERGEVVLIDAARRVVTGRVPLHPGLGNMSFEPRGRFSFALNPVANEVHVLDAATGSVAHHLTGLSAPDAVTFTDAYAYVRNAGAPKVSLVDRGLLGGDTTPPVVDVHAGQRAPASVRSGLAPFGMAPIAAAPDGKGVLIANAADKSLYFYTEGMMVPAGSLPGYGREPRAVLIEDRSLDEVRPGVYATSARMGADGRYDVEVLLDRPRMAVCLKAEVAPASDTVRAKCSNSGCIDEPSITVEPLFDTNLWLEAGSPVTLRFRAASKEGPALDAKEMETMIIRFPVGYRWSGAPQAEGDGTFSVTFTPPSAGEYRLIASAPARGLPPGTLPFVPLRVFAPDTGVPLGGVR